ncbi:hypothetical protein BG005_011108 [Podila minutissima]|nr:hypothetical protein BG005_011108 [Podila minutissima]
MYLTQQQSVILFTIVRVALQTSIVFLITHIASRTYNLTYLERINGGLFSQLNYILFTKFSSRRKHYLGRFYVALALVVTLALNLVPYLLSAQYPVETIYPLENGHTLDVSTQVLKPTTLSPGNITMENILSRMGVPLDGSKFIRYTVDFPPRESCRWGAQDNKIGFLDCGRSRIFDDSDALYPIQPLAAGKDGDMGKNYARQRSSTQEGVEFEFFNFSSNVGLSNVMVEMYERAAWVWKPANGPLSVEQCLRRRYRDHRCIRDSIGYRREERDDGSFVFYRRIFVQTIAGRLPTDGRPDLDCRKVATPALETMCEQIKGLGSPYPRTRNMYSIENKTQDAAGHVHWDVVATYGWTENDSIATTMFFEAFSLDMHIDKYKTTVDSVGLDTVKNDTTQARIEVDEVEVFEATYLVPDSAGPYNRSWIERGFSENDKMTLIEFLLRGTLLNRGKLVVLEGELLANVSVVAVTMLFAASVLVVLLGLIISRGVPAIIRQPFTEILREASDSNKYLPVDKKRSLLSLQRNRVANLVFEIHDKQDVVDDMVAQTPPPSLRRRLIALRMEIDSDNEDDTLKLLETTRNRGQGSSGSSM